MAPCYIITSYLAGDYFQALRNIIAPAAPMVHGSKVPWLLLQNESIVPSQIGLENQKLFIFRQTLSTRCN